jgi:hypothetical protein
VGEKARERDGEGEYKKIIVRYLEENNRSQVDKSSTIIDEMYRKRG